MDRTAATGRERSATRQVATLLLALADLAEFSVVRSPVVRTFVLWILWLGASAARDLIVEGSDMPDAFALFAPTAGSPEDAMRLAASLRDLAWLIDLIDTVACSACGTRADASGPCAAGPVAALDMLQRCLAALAPSACSGPHRVPVPDTS